MTKQSGQKRIAGTGRIEAFSDGVFAIIVTLLIFELHVPKLTDLSNATPMRLGEKPLIVLTLGKREPIPGMTEEETGLTRQGWLKLQAELAQRSSRGKQIIAKKSGHYIQFDQPELD